ncbi:insulin-like growth factor-binding protein complex acid labile subunit [Macrosteles quadrilineatus]|uniref:insulin-like growth factor-binding protein complex acid labile subunit n=1 Tax=Macrosteles quadrilineatus TaxID=74068 RepID=UPI0023E24F50|nr:insulin-like growth factor-binding protein complex acid labile subunit [Macrosteles quadrilineatus]
MWITLKLITVFCCVGVDWSHALEKDIEVACLDGKATTIEDGGVEANCGYQGLTRVTTFAPWLFQLANVLQKVNASHNHLKKVTVLPVLPRVLTLTLDHNSIKDIEPLAFTGLENLQNLDLSYNRISGESLKGVLVGKKTPGGDRFEPLPIRVLNLGHNNISSLEPDVVAHLQYLRDLYLDNNPITDIGVEFSQALQELTELKLLSLAECKLKTLPKDAFSGLDLTTLLLNGNQFTQVPDLQLLGNTLRVLNMNQNPIEELDDTSFAGLHRLNEIMISGMPKLTKIGSGTFSILENIKIISCTYNPQLVAIEEKAFWKLDLKRTMLQEVYLNNNNLPRVRKNLLPWLRMSKVTLDGNPWVCDCRLHWLAILLRSRNNTVDRLTEIKCKEPVWLNGKQIVFWDIDLTGRHENFPCLAEREEEKLLQQKLLLEQRKFELERIKNATPPKEEESSVKFYYIFAIAGVIISVLIIGAIIAFNKYRNYRPIYNVEKVSAMNNEMKYMKGSITEKAQLVP